MTGQRIIDAATQVIAGDSDYSTAFAAGRRAGLEEAAKIAEGYGTPIVQVYARGPNDPPDNVMVSLQGKFVADTIRATIEKETGDA